VIMSRFELGRRYTRDRIHDLVGGGSTQWYLPNKDGLILAACIRSDANPRAPAVILPGKGPQIERSGQIFRMQKTSVPTFLKITTGAWEFVGHWRVKQWSQQPDVIAEHARAADRVGDVSMVLFLESTD
jgi:hypothetical protein